MCVYSDSGMLSTETHFPGEGFHFRVKGQPDYRCACVIAFAFILLLCCIQPCVISPESSVDGGVKIGSMKEAAKSVLFASISPGIMYKNI